MKIACDIYGTLFRFPKPCWQILWNFPDHTLVHTTLDASKTPEQYAAHYQDSLTRTKTITWAPKIVVFIGKNEQDSATQKAEWCRNNGIRLLLDDNEYHGKIVRDISPGTMVLRVMP